jgi:hypothetical protein
MKNTNPELITIFPIPDLTQSINQGEHFDDVLTLSLRVLSHFFFLPNKVKVLKTYLIGESPLIVLRYQNKKFAMRIDFVQEFDYSSELKKKSDVVSGLYTENLRTFALANDLFPVIAGIVSHTEETTIRTNKQIINVFLQGKELWITKPLILLPELPPNQDRVKYPYPL